MIKIIKAEYVGMVDGIGYAVTVCINTADLAQDSVQLEHDIGRAALLAVRVLARAFTED